METKVTFTSVEFKNFKAFADFSLSLRHVNVLVGPNNCGKSTILGAFRVLATGLRRASSKSTEIVQGPEGSQHGYTISGEDHPVSLENVHTNYSEEKSAVTFKLSNGRSLVLFFTGDGVASLVLPGREIPRTRPMEFRKMYPVTVGQVPVLGPVEHDEPVLRRETIDRASATHRASRHFRNYWYHYPSQFTEFQRVIEQTWPGMMIKFPELSETPDGPVLHMFCTEHRRDRELYWVGFGFQVWCQLLTHILRSRHDCVLVADEPEIYLHPDMQRQLLTIFRGAGPDLLLATHSSELIGEADANDIVLIDKASKRGKRLKTTETIQSALDYLGSGHNITLTQIARSRHILFVEGEDFKLLRRWAESLGLKELASGVGVVPVSVGGFGQWNRVQSLGWGFRTALNQSMLLAAVFDRDYYCEEETKMIAAKLRTELCYVAILQRKEIENYLLFPSVLDRCVSKLVQDRMRRSGQVLKKPQEILSLLDEISTPMKGVVSGELVGKAIDFSNRQRTGDAASTVSTRVFHMFESKWANVESRLQILPGKTVLSELNARLQKEFGITLTPSFIIRETRKDEIPQDLVLLLDELNTFRKHDPPELRNPPPQGEEI